MGGGGFAKTDAQGRFVDEALKLSGEGIWPGRGKETGPVVLDEAIDAGRIGKAHARKPTPHGFGKGKAKPFNA